MYLYVFVIKFLINYDFLFLIKFEMSFFNNYNDIKVFFYTHVIKNTSIITFSNSHKNISNRRVVRESVLDKNKKNKKK